MCPKCKQIKCICHDKPVLKDSPKDLKRSKIDSSTPQIQLFTPTVSTVSVTKFGGLGFNALDTSPVGRKCRIMSWNIERLGDTGSLGKNKGVRYQDVIEAIAKIIFKADPHICALIEVFTGGRGLDEINRIFVELTKLCMGSKKVWDFKLSEGKGTGGLSDLDGSNRIDREGYALFWRADLGIECPAAKWLDIYKGEIYTESSRGRAYVRDACEFGIHINGKTFFGSHGMDLDFPIAVFHAPGPRADLQRQTRIKDSITSLFEAYASTEGGIDKYPNAFICADFNASEDADNLVTDESIKDIDYSFPGDLGFMSRLITLVTKVELMRKWVEINDLGKKKLDFLGFLKDFYAYEEFDKAAYKSSEKALKILESIAEDAELWFAESSTSLKLSGVREAEKKAKEHLNTIMEKRIKMQISNMEFQSEKERFKIWKKAINAKTEKQFRTAVENIEEIEEQEIIVYLTDEDTELMDWKELQKLVTISFEEEFEDQQAFLGSRNINTYTSKIVSVTMQNVRYLMKNNKKLDIVDSYETAFSSGVDTGFFESTSYDEKLKTTRRKSVLLTGFAQGKKGGKWTFVKTSSADSVLYSNYDQVLSRTDFVRIDLPKIETVPILSCVLSDKWKPAFDSVYFGCAFKELKIYEIDRFFVKICASANADYKLGLKKFKKPEYSTKTKVAVGIYKEYELKFKVNAPFCCAKQCATIEDIKSLYELQIYLTRSHAISDHEPVLMTALFKPHKGYDGKYI